MPCTTWLAAALRASVFFQEKESDAVWRSEVCREVRLAQCREEGPSSAAWADWSIRHPSLLGSDRASRRTLTALGEEPPREWPSLQGSGYWAGAVNDSDPYVNFYTHTKRRSSVTVNALRKWRLSPLLSPFPRPHSTWVVAAVAAVSTPTPMPNEKIRTYTR